MFRENLGAASNAVRSNRLRSSLTIAIIATGITSLVGIMTTIDALRSSLDGSFGRMGAGSFYITAGHRATSSAVHTRKKNGRMLTFSQVSSFVGSYTVPALSTVFVTVGETEVFRAGHTETEPRMTLMAADGNYLDFIGAGISSGRALTAADVGTAAYRCVLGEQVARSLFGESDPIGKTISVRGAGYEVVGVAERQGDSMDSFDNTLLIPVTNARMSHLNEESDWSVGITPESGISVSSAVDEAEVLFRSIRRLSPCDATDFEISRSDALSALLDRLMGGVTAAALIIGLITLLGAAVGLMNIMLVSVKERTREIGTLKALGAKSSTVRQQFFLESIIIGQKGCIIGILIGTSASNIILLSLGVKGMIPWFWMGAAVVLCLTVSMLSCSIPAGRAAALDPVEALRYE